MLVLYRSLQCQSLWQCDKSAHKLGWVSWRKRSGSSRSSRAKKKEKERSNFFFLPRSFEFFQQLNFVLGTCYFCTSCIHAGEREEAHRLADVNMFSEIDACRWGISRNALPKSACENDVFLYNVNMESTHETFSNWTLQWLDSDNLSRKRSESSHSAKKKDKDLHSVHFWGELWAPSNSDGLLEESQWPKSIPQKLRTNFAPCEMQSVCWWLLWSQSDIGLKTRVEMFVFVGLFFPRLSRERPWSTHRRGEEQKKKRKRKGLHQGFAYSRCGASENTMLPFKNMQTVLKDAKGICTYMMIHTVCVIVC